MKSMVTFILSILLSITLSVTIMAEEQPKLRHVLDIHARCGKARDAVNVNGGKRVIIPITGGTVDGVVTAKIIPGGADYQMIDTISGRVSLNAVYSIETEDNCQINVTNSGVIFQDAKSYYFMTSPKFEAPTDSPYDWLNNRIFVCKPIGFEDGMVTLRVWVVE